MMRWALFVLLGAGAVGYARWVYRSMELPVAGRRFLWPLRAATLIVLLALLLDLPAPGSRLAGSSARWVLLDASLSMTAGEGPETPWRVASARAEELRDEGWRVVTFGADVELADSLEAVRPEASATRLAPALTLAAEGGARNIRVLSDMRIEDRVEVRGVLDALPATVAFESAGASVLNAGVLGLEVEDRSDRQADGTAFVDVHGGGSGDTLKLEIREEGRAVTETRVPAPTQGLRRTVEVALPPASEPGLLRYEAVLSDHADGFALDDRASAYGRVGLDEEGGVVLVSLRPDWEPRYLLPVLERTTGLAPRGYLRAGADRFVTMGRAADRGIPVDSATVRRAVRGADLLVLHGMHADLSPWERALAEPGTRKLVFVTDQDAAEALGLATTSPRSGEWYVVPEVPASPIAGELAGMFPEDLPPLRNLLVAPEADGLLRPLLVQRESAEPGEAPLYLRVEERGRTAFVLASGFWRWSARGRGAYRALWAGVAGWLLREPSVAGTDVRPTSLVVPRGEPVEWRIPPDRAGVRVRVRRAPDMDGDESAGEVVRDTLFADAGVVATGPMDVGAYRYTVLDSAADSVSGGRFDVSTTTADMLPAAVDPDELELPRSSSRELGGGDRPLRTLPWPYLLIIGLLAAEWVGRRKSGLR
ncbi:MAG: VWA domain-containing protein [Gemmatimonadota bacterium]|nr:VWA domain-containing protein [Gemmatimonadota bacterium]